MYFCLRTIWCVKILNLNSVLQETKGEVQFDQERTIQFN